MRKRAVLIRQEAAVARLHAAMHPEGWFAKVDPDVLWR